MEEKTLAKLYYGDREAYLRTYRARFTSEDAVLLNFYIGDYQAFFVQNTAVLRLAYDIAKLNGSVIRLSSSLPGVAKQQYSRKCLIDEIVLTNNIEGVHSSRKEIGEALNILAAQSSNKGKRNRFVGLVHKYLKLLAEESVPLASCEDVRVLYDDMFLEEVISENPANAPDGAIFRKDMSSVHSESGKEIHRGVYPESKIIACMNAALGFLHNDSVDPLFRLCVFHYLVEYIHPFYDGNGRLGRFILSYCLTKELEPLVSYRISETIKENIRDYYRAFQLCNDPHNLGDLTPFLLMMLRMIHSALHDLNDSLSRRLFDWHRYERLLSTFPSAAEANVRRMYSLLIQAALFSEIGISTQELEAHMGESYYTVKKSLSKIPASLLHSEKQGRAMCYRLNLSALEPLLPEE